MTVVLLFPFALSWLNLAIPRARVGYGFSGIAMAFLGVLGLFVVAAAARRPDGRVAIDHAPGLFFVGAAVIAALAVPISWLRLGLVLACMLAAAYTLTDLIAQPSIAAVRTALTRRDGLALPLGGLAVFLLVPNAAFPPNRSTVVSS